MEPTVTPSKLGLADRPLRVTQFTGVNSSGFKDFVLKSELNRAIKNNGFEHPSEVQQDCIPAAIEGRDIICQARAGTGKTAVFIIAILNQMVEEDAKPGMALIMANTRELANQIKNEFDRFTEFMPWVRKECFLGGQNIKDQQKILKNEQKAPHIVIGTPGRILQLVNEKSLKLDNNKIFVLDECDKLIHETDMRDQVQKIFVKGNPQRQVMMFSATFPADCKVNCRKFMKDPFELYVDSDSGLVLHGLKQYFVKLENNAKISKLIQLLDDLEFNQVVVFTEKKAYAHKLNEVIQNEKFPSIVCHSDMSTDQRIAVYNKFKEGKHRILVSTDLMGRGIDIEKVNVVFNFDMPKDEHQYMHRVGRAGRFGTKGLAISFISTPDDTELLDKIQSKFEVKVEELPSVIEKSHYMNN